MNINLNFENTPSKSVKMNLEEKMDSLQKTELHSQRLKNELKKMSYKAMAECLFEISTQIPTSQELIQSYLPKISIVENQTSLRELAHNFHSSVAQFNHNQLIIKEELKMSSLIDDFTQISGVLQGNQEVQDIYENVKNDLLRQMLRKMHPSNESQREKDLRRELVNSEKQNQRLQEKLSLSEKSVKIKKLHLQEYLNEIEQMRNKIVQLEEANQSLRVNFDNTIRGIETKVDREKEKIYEQVMNDYKSEISRKNDKINEMEKESCSHLSKYKKTLEDVSHQSIQKTLSELRIQLDMKNETILSLNKKMEDLEGFLKLL